MTQIEELEARIAELEEAVEWAIKELKSVFGSGSINAEKLQSRAFPPKFETVKVVKDYCPKCDEIVENHFCRVCSTGDLVKITGSYPRKIIPKTKHREELALYSCNGGTIRLEKPDATFKELTSSRYFMEWEE